MRYILIPLLALWFSLLPAFSQSMNTRFVAVESTALKSSAGFFSRQLGTLQLGDEVTVLHDSGRWSEVRAENIIGWVTSASLSSRRTTRLAPIGVQREVAMAGRGFGRDIESAYQLAGGPDYSAVDMMETMIITPEELQRFIIEGRLTGGDW